MKNLSCVACLSALLLSSLSNQIWADNAATTLPSVESFFKVPDICLTTLSPHGNFVAFVNQRDDETQVVIVCDTADLTKFTIASSAKKGDKIQAVRWVNEHRLIVTTHFKSLEFVGNNDVFAVDQDGKNLKHLISGDWNHHQQSTGSNISDKTLTAEYAFFSVTYDDSDDVIVLKYMFSHLENEINNTHLFRLNTKTRQLSELYSLHQPDKVNSWLLDAHDSPRITHSQIHGRCIVSYREADSEDWKEISNENCYNNTSFSPLHIDASGNMIVEKSHQGYSALFNYDLTKMKIEDEPFLFITGFDFEGGIESDSRANKVLGIHFKGDAKSTVWFDPTFKVFQQKIDKKLTQTINTIHCGIDCLHSPALLITAASDRIPTEYFIYTTTNDTLIGLGSTHPKIKPEQMGTRDFVHFTARDGRSIPTYITLPPGKLTAPMPAIVLVHGGPWVRGSSWEWEPDAQFLASRGYVVIQPEFRGSTGFGHEHFQAGLKQWGQTMQDDLADAAKWAIQKNWADPKRIAIMGASYGGYATLMGLIKNPELFRCGVEWIGVTDMALRFNTPQGDASVETLNYDLKTLMGDPVTDAEMFKQNSPLVNAAKLTQPLLMAYGALDRRVPIVHAADFYSAVKKTNDQVEWIIYSDEGHGWYHEKNNIDFWQHVEKFLDKNLKNSH